MPKPPTHTFYVQGIHCAACELIIKDLLDEGKYIASYTFSASTNKIDVSFTNSRFADPKLALFFIQQIFQDTSYVFSLQPSKNHHLPDMLFGISAALIIIFIIILSPAQNIITQPNLDNSSSYLAFFIFGLLASISSCAVLVGGIILSLAKTWFKNNQPKWQPILSFQIGRIAGFAFGGLILGLIGRFFHVSYMLSAFLLIIVSLLMILAGLDFLGCQVFSRLFKGNNLPQLAQKSAATSLFWPAAVGLLTFFIPCGFTATVQLLSFAAASPSTAALIMTSFVLGTVPMLSLIAFSGSFYQGNQRLNRIVSYCLGALIIAFGLINLNTQFRALNLPNFDPQILIPAPTSSSASPADNLVPMDGEVQVIQLTAEARGYKPSSLTIRAHTPTRLEIDVLSVSGCSNAIIAPAFFEEKIPLVAGETVVKEFISPASGKYKITCWMNMMTVNVEVI